MNNYIEKLKSVGLTQNEARAYLFLLEYQEAKGGLISSKLKIPTSHIYHILEKLLDKGIVSFKIVNNTKIFRPVDPQRLFTLFREKEKQLEREKEELKGFIKNLKKIEVKKHRQNDFKYFEGIAGVKSMFTEFIESWEPNSEIYVSSAPIAYERWNAFLLETFHPPRVRKSIHLKLIVPSKLRERGEERQKVKYTEVRYSEKELASEFGVAGDYTYFLSYGERPYALLIKDRNFAGTQKQIFETMWRSIK